jgi:hypothetical protein
VAKKILIACKGPKLKAYWVAVGKGIVSLTDGKGEITLSPGKHMLVWWMLGNPGDTLAIELSDVKGSNVAQVKESKIPAKQNDSAGRLRFTLGA